MFDVSAFDAGDAVLAHVKLLGQLGLVQAEFAADFGEPGGPDFAHHGFFQGRDPFFIDRTPLQLFLQGSGAHLSIPFRCLSQRSSATGMFLVYHFVQLPALSPATSKIALLAGSKAKRILMAERLLEPGRSSFRFLRRAPLIVSTRGR